MGIWVWGIHQPGHNDVACGINGFRPGRDVKPLRHIGYHFDLAVFYSDNPMRINIKSRINRYEDGIVNDGVVARQ